MKKRPSLLWLPALALLAIALVLFNLPPDGFTPVTQPHDDSSAPIGYHVGEQLPDFTLTRTDGTDFTLSEYRGRVVILNLWATWCGPCIGELPYFDRLQREHPDEVVVLAIHSDQVLDDVSEWLSGYDYQIGFAVDETGEVVASVGGSSMLPQTIVLNPRGEVIFNRAHSITFEQLEELLRQASAADAKPIRSLLRCSFSVTGGMENIHTVWTLARDEGTGSVTLPVADNGVSHVYQVPDDAPETLLALFADHPPETWEALPPAEYFALDAPERFLELSFSNGSVYSIGSDREGAGAIHSVTKQFLESLVPAYN